MRRLVSQKWTLVKEVEAEELKPDAKKCRKKMLGKRRANL